VRLQSPPVDDAANDELVTLIAEAVGVPRRSVSIVAGTRNRLKRIQIVGVDAASAEAALAVRRQ
jgi:uncharacterized protein YggU (UPF0235/DUF167 family)